MTAPQFMDALRRLVAWPNAEREDNLLVLVGVLAAGGVCAIALLWGLPA